MENLKHSFDFCAEQLCLAESRVEELAAMNVQLKLRLQKPAQGYEDISSVRRMSQDSPSQMRHRETPSLPNSLMTTPIVPSRNQKVSQFTTEQAHTHEKLNCSCSSSDDHNFV